MLRARLGKSEPMVTAILFDVTIEEATPTHIEDENRRKRYIWQRFDMSNVGLRFTGHWNTSEFSRLTNNYVLRGIIGEPIWKMLLRVTFVAVLVPGLQEILLPLLAVTVFSAIMSMLILPKSIAPWFQRIINQFEEKDDEDRGHGDLVFGRYYGRKLEALGLTTEEVQDAFGL